jgi:DtxR family Mn-dependent transcriptional regulator
MLPSITVENYLKAIYLGVAALPSPERLLPMGQLAAALRVAPGTATTMVKTLADSGLVEYEPYTGVRLTPAGDKLAAMVVRRHRLIELFLVRVMGLSWDEVHEEAEQLEHAVSDRLIDRIDEMLGRPAADPHGDPIPNSDGAFKPQNVQSLMTCPLDTPVTVTRVVDQDKIFLRFIESHDLKPGQSIRVEERDPASDSVRLRGKDDRSITIGARAASKLLVQVAGAILVALVLARPADAQPRPFEILDNSFLVEEAFNQEPGIFQNIFNIVFGEGNDWEASFTQEWPFRTQTHQLSFTVPFASLDGESGAGDVLINYRLQAFVETASTPAFSPRFSLILPTGSSSRGLGNGGAGWQVNLPFSKQFGDAYVHWNAGFTHIPSAEGTGRTHNLLTPHAAISGIWRLRPMVNLMLESIIEREEFAADVESHQTVFTLSPGIRTGWNTGDAQVILGFAIPVTTIDGNSNVGMLAYFSYELPFRR